MKSWILLGSSLLVAGCGSGSAGLVISASESVGSASSSLTSASTPTPPPTFTSSDGVTFSLAQARVHLRDIRLDLPAGTGCEEVIGGVSGAECKGSEDSNTVVVRGPILIDLLTGRSSPDLSQLKLPAGIYKRIDFRLEDAHKEELPAGDELIDHTLIVRAEFTHEGAPTRLELLLKFSEDARIESSGGVEISGDSEQLLALLNPAIWLEGIPVGACLQKKDVEITDGVLRIDDRATGDCSAAEDTVKRNIKRSGELREK